MVGMIGGAKKFSPNLTEANMQFSEDLFLANPTLLLFFPGKFRKDFKNDCLATCPMWEGNSKVFSSHKYHALEHIWSTLQILRESA